MSQSNKNNNRGAFLQPGLSYELRFSLYSPPSVIVTGGPLTFGLFESSSIFSRTFYLLKSNKSTFFVQARSGLSYELRFSLYSPLSVIVTGGHTWCGSYKYLDKYKYMQVHTSTSTIKSTSTSVIVTGGRICCGSCKYLDIIINPAWVGLVRGLSFYSDILSGRIFFIYITTNLRINASQQTWKCRVKLLN